MLLGSVDQVGVALSDGLLLVRDVGGWGIFRGGFYHSSGNDFMSYSSPKSVALSDAQLLYPECPRALRGIHSFIVIVPLTLILIMLFDVQIHVIYIW